MKAEYSEILREIKSNNALLVAVSKVQPLAKIEQLYKLGHRDFGENRVQEFLEKYEKLPADIKWHLIGHLQTNKVKDIICKSNLIHAVDRIKLARKIDALSSDLNVTTRCLLQIKIAQEDSKYGYRIEQLLSQLNEGQLNFPNITWCGVMGMATYTMDMNQVRTEFRKLKDYHNLIKRSFFDNRPDFCELSMGMSGDYKVALEEGATIVRIGSKIFGPRQ